MTSALNAIAHAAEGLYAHDGNPIMSLMAEEGIRAAAAALPPLLTDARDLEARSDALYAAWLCGTVLGNVAMGLHHKLCHTLGGTLQPAARRGAHGGAAARARLQRGRGAEAMARIARAVADAGRPAASAPRAVFDLARDHGAPTALRDDRHAGRRPGPRRRPRGAEPVPEPAAARTRRDPRAAATRVRGMRAADLIDPQHQPRRPA